MRQLHWGMIRWPDGESQVGNLARTPGNPLLFEKGAMRSLMTTVSQDLGLTSHLKDDISYSTVSPSLHWGIGIIRTRGKAAPYWPTNTTSSSNLVFPGGLPSSTSQAHTCLASVIQQKQGPCWYGCRLFCNSTFGVKWPNLF